jgi:2-polyprenyl-6-methoxyphenol hydroxylase-like FAD-dependent oxidoreductase
VLGDAVHAMTPTLGRGANLAMRGGALLGRVLNVVAAGESDLADALADYERDMLGHGFAVVTEAAEIGEQRMAQNPLPA